MNNKVKLINNILRIILILRAITMHKRGQIKKHTTRNILTNNKNIYVL